MRAPYAPGQRSPRGSRRSVPGDAGQTPELEATTPVDDELAVTNHRMEMAADQGLAQEPSAADHTEAFAPPARPEHLPPAHHYNGHARDTGRRNGHTRERERDHTYTPTHQRSEFERDGERDSLEADMLDGDERGSAEFVPRGDVRGEVGALIDDLKAIFQHDRATASATGGTRCGICYLHFALDALEYRDDEGYYVCASCAQALGTAWLPMVRRQKRG